MIKNFLHSLEEAINDRATSIVHIRNIVSGFTIPQYNKKDIDPLAAYKPSISMPCLNTDCRWLDYLETFYPDTDLWQLPAHTDMGLCVICDMKNKRQLDISKLAVSKNRTVIITDHKYELN
jgi:hypothetical protein